MGAMVPVDHRVPDAVKKLAALATTEMISELTGGVVGGFPVISYKGKVWRVREGGEEQMNLDAGGNAVPTIDIVLVQANPSLSKIFYDGAYVEGSSDAPDCFSNLGDKPDPSVQNPISRSCAVCPKNVWGSKITEAGKKTKACQDSRRMAVAFADDLYNNAATPDSVRLFLLRVPPASLTVLKDYQEKQLGPRGLPFFGLVTRVGFDPQLAHPQFSLKPARFLNDEEAEAVIALRGSPRATRILAEAQDLASGESHGAGELTEGTQEETMAPAPAPRQAAAKPAAAAAAKPAAMRPASDEEAGAATLQQPPPKAAAKPKPAAAAAAAPKPAKAAAKPAAVQQPVEPEEAPASDGSIDDMLDQILNG